MNPFLDLGFPKCYYVKKSNNILQMKDLGGFLDEYAK